MPSTQPNVMTFDLATTTGFAGWTREAGVKSGHFKIGQPELGIGRFLHAFDTKATELIRFFKPDWMIFEAPFVGERTSQDTARVLLCLAGELERICYREGIPEHHTFEAYHGSVKSYFIGRGNLPSAEGKRLMREKCRELGWSPGDDNEADALGILHYAVHWHRLPIELPQGGLLGTAA